MKMAKPDTKDIKAAEDLCQLLNIVDTTNTHLNCAVIDEVPDLFELHDNEGFDEGSRTHLQALFNKLAELIYHNPAFHHRVISGMCHVIMYDKNEIIDPDSDTIDLHPRFQEMHDELQRETQAARYWNKRYHQLMNQES